MKERKCSQRKCKGKVKTVYTKKKGTKDEEHGLRCDICGATSTLFPNLLIDIFSVPSK